MSDNFKMNHCAPQFQTKDHLVEPRYAFKLVDIKLWHGNLSNNSQNEQKSEQINVIYNEYCFSIGGGVHYGD